MYVVLPYLLKAPYAPVETGERRGFRGVPTNIMIQLPESIGQGVGGLILDEERRVYLPGSSLEGSKRDTEKGGLCRRNLLSLLEMGVILARWRGGPEGIIEAELHRISGTSESPFIVTRGKKDPHSGWDELLHNHIIIKRKSDPERRTGTELGSAPECTVHYPQKCIESLASCSTGEGPEVAWDAL